jgi:hypothetical protein
VKPPAPLRSLRVQLAALGLVPALVTLLVLLAVAVATENVRVEVDAAGTVVTADDRGLSAWVPATAAVMAVAAAVAAWWWAGRVVRPIRDVADLADRTGSGSLADRLRLTGVATEVQTLADRFDTMLDRLAAASAVQQSLAEDASHELRTPLAVLATTADVVLARPGTPPSQLRDAVTRMRATVSRMSATVDTLLSRARAGGTWGDGGTDLAALVRRVADEHAPTAAASGVRVTVEGPPRVPAAFDSFSLERAVANLVDNAVRHSPPGAVVTVTVGSAGSGLHRRSFTAVTDTGPGIPGDDQDRVFDRYWRGDQGGTGIGLSLVRLVAEAHDGVEVTSPVADGHGTRFTLWFRAPA